MGISHLTQTLFNASASPSGSSFTSLTESLTNFNMGTGTTPQGPQYYQSSLNTMATAITDLFSQLSSSIFGNIGDGGHNPKTSFLMRFYSVLDKASATSTYADPGDDEQETFSATNALSLGSGYWCSRGGHKKDEIVIFAGDMKHRKKISGVKVQWAYAPGKVQVEVSPDGVHYQPVVRWHDCPRNEVVYEQNLLFDRPRNVKAVRLLMKDPRDWKFYGINQINLLR